MMENPESLATQGFRAEKQKNQTFRSGFCGARGGSRTRTPLRAPAPEAGESTNSTTRASGSCSITQNKVYNTTRF